MEPLHALLQNFREIETMTKRTREQLEEAISLQIQDHDAKRARMTKEMEASEREKNKLVEERCWLQAEIADLQANLTTLSKQILSDDELLILKVINSRQCEVESSGKGTGRYKGKKFTVYPLVVKAISAYKGLSIPDFDTAEMKAQVILLGERITNLTKLGSRMPAMLTFNEEIRSSSKLAHKNDVRGLNPPGKQHACCELQLTNAARALLSCTKSPAKREVC